MKTLVINFFGGPGAGKSSAAAYVYGLLKWQGVKAELITEYAKDRVWEGSLNVLKHQEYVYAKQKHRMWRCAGQVDVIVTDAPLLHCIYYDQTHNKAFSSLVSQAIGEFDNINVFVDRVAEHYQTEGRYQSLEKALDIDASIRFMLCTHDPKYLTVLGQEEEVRQLTVDHLLPAIQKKLNHEVTK